MKEEKFASLSDQKLLDKRKSLKTQTIFNAVLIGILLGVSIYGTVKSGFSFFTFFPLFFVFLLIKSKSDSKEIENEIKSRNLNL